MPGLGCLGKFQGQISRARRKKVGRFVGGNSVGACVEMLEDRRLLSAVVPIISEIVAGNKTGLKDSFGNASDWLEIYNPDGKQAVNLAGYKLRYGTGPTDWSFPSMTLGPGEFRIIFASGKNLIDPTQELHTNFKLSKDGKYLALLNGIDVVQAWNPYPAQATGTSFGVGEAVVETKLVAGGANAYYYVPAGPDVNRDATWMNPNYADWSWSQGPTGIGYANLVPGFAVTNYKSNLGDIPDLTVAMTVPGNTTLQSWVKTEVAPYINYFNSGDEGRFGNNRAFPGMTMTVDEDHFVLKATGIVHIPSAGNWVFGANTDDGFTMTVNGQTFSYPGLRGPGDTFGTIIFPAAGDYDMSFLFFENGGGSGAEVFAAKEGDGNYQLVGDTANGGLPVVSYPVGSQGNSSLFASSVLTDVRTKMQQANSASIYTRIKFDAPNLASLQSLTLKMKYDDGYVAYLNGVEIARRNAPAAVSYNSAATASRGSDALVTTFENIDISQYLNSATAGHLNLSGNVLAIQVMNSSATDGDLLVIPELSQIVSTQLGDRIFAIPTPGAPNEIGTWQPDLKIGMKHGFYDVAFPVTLTTTMAGASVYYTTDSSTPSVTNGTRYTGPINISATTTLRAVAVYSGGSSGVVETETYIFLNDVINQPANPAGFPTTWGDSTIPSDYQMDPRITSDPAYMNTLKQGLLSLPTISVVSDKKNLFDPVTGIYTNLDNLYERNGVVLQTGASIEYFNPDGSGGFQVDAALQMTGGVGRYPEFKKHSLHVSFPAAYGSKLNYQLFEDSPVTQYDSFILRSGFNDTWTWAGSNVQFIRDAFAAYTHLAMGEADHHSKFVHLYIDGLYWGLYMMAERPDAAFAASYFGGSKENWEANNSGAGINGVGTATQWNNLQNFASQNGNDLSPLATYMKLQGKNADDTVNPAYPNLLDVTNYADYMLMNLYVGNTDWPWHNFYAARMNDPGSTGFKFFDWDAEWSLGLQSDVGANVTGVYDGAAAVYNSLRASADFRMLFADRVYKFMFNNGAMTAAQSVLRYQTLANEVETAVVAESARWGDVATQGGAPHTQAEWINQRDWILNTYLPQRSDVVIAQLRAAGLYSSIDAPSFSLNGASAYGGTFNLGDLIAINATNSPIYYTLDGSDPRWPGGALNPAAILYTGPITPARGMQIKARVYSNSTWSALADAGFYVNLAPSLRISEVMYSPLPATQDEINRGYVDTGNGANDFEYIEIRNIGTLTLPLQGLRLTNGVNFMFPAISVAPNQSVLVVSNLDAFKIRYPGVSAAIIAGQYTGHLDNAGEMIELDAPNGGMAQSFTYDPKWYSLTDGQGFSLTARDVTQALPLWNVNDGWRTSAAPGGSPGTTDALPNPGAIAFNEILAHPATSGGDMIEIRNMTGQAVNIGGWFVSDSATNLSKYQIPANTTLAANGYLVLSSARNYGATSGDPGVRQAFTLNPLGGDLYLSSNVGAVVGGYREHVNIDYAPAGVSQGLYVKTTGQTDFALLQTPTFGTGPNYAGAANSSHRIAPLVFNEIMYDPSVPTAAEISAGFTDNNQFEFIELYNRTSGPLTLRDFYIGEGVGFSFGWYPDGNGAEVNTLEAGATATWTASNLQASAYTVYAHYSLLDANGNRRTNLDGLAQYTITYAGGSATVTVDQNQATVVGNDVWVNLGEYSFSGPATVRLTRGDTHPDNWTVADSVKFSRTGQDVVVIAPSLDSFSMRSGMTTVAAGGYVVLVSNYAAFDARYHVAANNIPVAGAYTGLLNNAGDMVRLFQMDTAIGGFVPYAQIDHVTYENHTPWATEPDGHGPALMRVHPAAYGNEPVNWRASNKAGTPGKSNTPFDNSAPTIPGSLTGRSYVGPTRIVLNWSASTASQSGVDHYVIYRNNQIIASSTTTSFTDTNVQATTLYSYQVSAVNRDGYEGGKSTTVNISAPGILTRNVPSSRKIVIYFNEPLQSAPATLIGNYIVSGRTVSSATLSRQNSAVTLTLSQDLTIGAVYTVTLNNLIAVSGNALPGSQQFSFTYASQGMGSILREYWTGISGSAITDMTGNANYPNKPSGRSLLSSFETPAGWGYDYGSRVRGYITPPTTGSYTFWISSDDASELWLSTDETAGNAVKIAGVTGSTSYHDWTNQAGQKSVPITLQAGKRYYVEALHKQGGGWDSLSVRWQLPDGSWENGDANAPIPGSRLTALGEPVDMTAPLAPTNLRASVSNTKVNLEWDAAVDPESGIDHYVIYRDGQVLGTSTSAFFSDTSVSPKARHSYQVSAVNWDGYEGARCVAISAVPPGVASVVATNYTSLKVVFTEPVTRATAELKSNYQITGGAAITISSAKLESDGITVTLITSSNGTGTRTLTVSNITTLAGSLMPPQATTFTYGGTIDYDYWLNIGGGTAVSDLTGNAAYPNSPTGHQVLTSFDAPINWGDAYGARIRGYILPPTTGLYTFWIASDDNSQLWLSTDDNPANKRQIAYVGGWTPHNDWDYAGDQQRSAAISLVAGQRYYIEALMKEGGGGDNLSVAWQLPGTTFNTGDHGTTTPIDGAYLAPYTVPAAAGTPLAITVDFLATGDGTPALSGTVSDPSVVVTVKIANVYYAAANNGNGSWSLSRGAIKTPLTSGTYDVVVSAISASGQIAFDTTTSEVVIDTATPTVTVTSIATRDTALSSIAFQFSEAVSGFDIADVCLTRDGGSDLIMGSEILTPSADKRTWTLSGLSGVSGDAGFYSLTLKAIGAGIKDSGGNLLGTDRSSTWAMNAINGPAGADLALSLNGNLVDIFAGGTYSYSVNLLNQTQIKVNLGTGADALTLDFSHGGPLPSGGLIVSGSTAADSLIVVGTSVTDSLTINPSQVLFGAAPISCTGIETIQLGQAGSNLALGSLTFNANAKAALSPGAGMVLRTKSLSMASSATFDIADNGLIIDAIDDKAAASALVTVTARIGSARNSSLGLWKGAGLTSSTARGRVDGVTGLAAIVNRDSAGQPVRSTYGDQSVPTNCVLVGYTYIGDADLSGKVDRADYFRLNRGLLTGGVDFANGDFDYDGRVTADDYHFIDMTYLMQGPPMLAGDGAPIGNGASQQAQAAPASATPLNQHTQPATFAGLFCSTATIVDKASAAAPTPPAPATPSPGTSEDVLGMKTGSVLS